MASWLIAFTIGLPWLGALACLGVGDGRPRAQHGLAVGFAAGAGLAALGLLPFATSDVLLRLPAGGVFGDWTFVPDGLGVFLAVIATVVGSLTILFSAEYMRGEAQLGRYYALILLFIGAMAGLVLAGSLLLLFFFWELVAFCSYALISFHNDDPKAVAGGVKALVITQLGAIGLLGGALLTHAELGSDQINALLVNARHLPPSVLRLIAFGFLAAAVAKSAQVPFHTWLPDAMEAPTPVSALIHAATMVNAGVYLLARFYPAFAPVPGWTTAVMAIGVVSLVLAAIMALAATDLKRVLAYSTISQLGYMVYAVGAGAIFASQFHLLSHSVFKALLFLAAGVVIQVVGTRDMCQMGGLSRRMPFVCAVFLVGALALVGLPFLNGFWSKELVIETGLARGPWWAAVGLLLGIGLTALYTFRMTWMVFFRTTAAQPMIDARQLRGQADRRSYDVQHSSFSVRRSSPSSIVLGLLALCTLTTWLLAGPFGNLLSASLPFHGLLAETTAQVCIGIIRAPSTLLALTVTLLGLAGWWWRERLAGLTNRFRWLDRAARAEFGFEWLNDQVAGAILFASRALSATQTGQLNWNMVGIVGGLVIVLAILAWGVI
jgi:NADH-quinone oxidoreductase subunit L